MGTPEFAVASLKTLVENGYNVVGVVTMPDKPAGRGYKLQPSAVKSYALEQGLTILQPEKLKDETFLKELKQLNADVQVVVAFRMLPEVVWNMPPYGTFNLHSSLLPQYRGAAPINWAIINGEKETGITTFFLTHEIDTGKIIFQEKTTISEDDNAESLHNRLMLMGADLAQKTIDAIIDSAVQSVSQSELYENESDLKPAPKIFKETCRINWNKSAHEVRNFIRGLSPYPTAWTELSDNDNIHTFKLFSCEIIEEGTQKLSVGTIKTDNKTFLHVAVKDGFVNVTDVQMSGKKRMKISDFLNGYKFGEGTGFV
jgi:methionyl-tRNA formyltransferase